MTCPTRPRARPGHAAIVVAVVLASIAAPVRAADDPIDPRWALLYEQSRQVLSDLARHQVDAHDRLSAVVAVRPRMVVIGFTGGLERENSNVSGVVRLRRRIAEEIGDTPTLEARAYSNFAWRRAASDVVALARARTDGGMVTGEALVEPPPLVVVYGHSWGAGAISKFARELGREGLDVALAVYIDAFTWRNPRVPPNVRYAVNIFQRTGLLRGLPLRGKSTIVPQSPADTVILANLRVTPQTEHFGWNWNLVQPILYRHHHRIGHDVRIQRLLLDLASLGAVPAGRESGLPQHVERCRQDADGHARRLGLTEHVVVDMQPVALQDLHHLHVTDRKVECRLTP